MARQRVEEVRRPGPARRLLAALAALLLFLLIVAVILWAFRVRIVSEYIERELRVRGVDATYEVKRIGPGSQIFENLVIGDPEDPDLTARRVEVEVRFGVRGPDIGLITARGVRVRGRIVEGELDLGQLDRLMPPTPEDVPFRLPDQRVDIADSVLLLEGPAGPVRFAVEGQGNLADGFRGQVVLASPGLSLGECRIADPRARLAVSVEDLRPTLTGPLAFHAVRCGDDFAVRQPRFEIDATLGSDFQSWEGRADARAARLAAGPNSLADLVGDVSFTGDAERTRGAVRVRAADSRLADLTAGRMSLAAGYELSLEEGDLRLAGDLSGRGLRIDRSALAGLASSLRSVEGLPFAPVADELTAAVVQASTAGAEARADFTLVNRSGEGALRLERLQVDARSGASFRLSGGEGLAFFWPGGRPRVDGTVTVSGGGLPDARFALSQPRPGGPIEGQGRIAPMAARGARLDLGAIRFSAAPDGTTRIRTVARATGPFQGGWVEGLTVPVVGRVGDGFAFGEECVTASFDSFRYEALRIGPTRLSLCPAGPAMVFSTPAGSVRGGFAVAEPRIAGTLGGTPLRLAADRLRFGLARTDFTIDGLQAAIGAEPSATLIEVGTLTGAFGADGAGGEFAGLTGRIPNVPLVFGEGGGEWRFAGGELDLSGHLAVADAQDPSRFHPLESDDFRFTLSGNRIQAGGWLHDPETGIRITEASVRHDLDTGRGEAVLDVPGIDFAVGGLQPDDLTRMTVGVVALVEGTVTGRGVIRWDEAGVTSTGTFSTAEMDLAAPFGPVEGLTTTIEFTDLLGLVSAPGQTAQFELIRAGIDVYDGLVTYQLLADNHVRIAAGRWPYAGGVLILEPTVLDFSQSSTKYLTFRVIGLEAARFIEAMEFGNIAATGKFDGVIPVVVDQSGARIVDGRLSARPPGGTLSYIGELTDRDLGVYGKLAFDALKALRYSRFDLLMDGSLAGEFVARVELDGVARDPELTTIAGGGLRGVLTRRVFSQLARIPFEFNIRIEGPFQALLATARSFDDPTPLIQQALPPILREPPDVQNQESEDMP